MERIKCNFTSTDFVPVTPGFRTLRYRRKMLLQGTPFPLTQMY